MKKRIRTIAVVALLAMASSCQKENIIEPSMNNQCSTMRYTIGETTYSFPLSDNRDQDSFWEFIFALVEEGQTVVVNSQGQLSTKYKETITYTTTNHADAIAWSKNMTSAGYAVSITYNKTTGVYTCTAQK